MVMGSVAEGVTSNESPVALSVPLTVRPSMPEKVAAPLLVRVTCVPVTPMVSGPAAVLLIVRVSTPLAPVSARKRPAAATAFCVTL